MEGQKRQDTERTNDVGDGWMNLGSLLLGLTACGKGGDPSASGSAGSTGSAAMS